MRIGLQTIVVALVVGPVGLAQTGSTSVAAIRPVAVWPSGPLDVVAAFADPVDPAAARSLVGKSISYFEPAGPAAGGATSPRPLGALRIVGARLADAGRTLVLATDPHPRLARYVLPLPATGSRTTAQKPVAAETSYDLAGVDVTWSPEGGPDDQPQWTGWWPLLDLRAARALTRGSRPHDDGLALLARPGRLVVGTLLRLPRGTMSVRIESSQPIEEATLGDAQAESIGPRSPIAIAPHRALLTVPSQGDPLFLSITCRTGANSGPFSLSATYRTGEDRTDHPIERQQLILPWAPLPAPAATTPLVVPDLSGGDPERGRIIFNSEQARCGACHAFRGQGGKIGPDLTDLGKKGRAEIYRAIAAPSASIEPEFTSYSVATRNGQVIVGIVQAEGADAIRVTDTNAHATVVSRHEVDQIRPSANSIMPVGLTGALGTGAVRDLIAFLTGR